MHPLQLKFCSSVIHGVSVDYVLNFHKLPTREILRSLAKQAITLGSNSCLVREWRSSVNAMYTIDWLIWTDKQSADERLENLLKNLTDLSKLV